MKAKKLLSVLLSLALVIGLFPLGIARAESFNDTGDAPWAEAAIDRWSGYGVVSGMGDGSFNPTGTMTRAQAATVFTNLLGLTSTAGAMSFTDVAPGAWYASAIARVTAAGIMNGMGDGTMNPDGEVTREQFFVMFARAMGIAPQNTTSGAAADGSSWSAGYINALTDRGFVKGDGSGVNALANINRASVMTLLDQTITTYANVTGQTVTAQPSGVTLVVANNVTVTGEADTVVAAVQGGSITMDGATAKSVTVVADTDVALTGAAKVDSITVNEGATGASINVGSGATVGNITSNADNSTITNSGTVTGSIATTGANSGVTNSGTVGGSVSTSGSNSRVTNSGTVSGNITTSGTNSGVTNSSTGTVGGNVTTTGTDSAISNTGKVTGTTTASGGTSSGTGGGTTTRPGGTTSGGSSGNGGASGGGGGTSGDTPSTPATKYTVTYYKNDGDTTFETEQVAKGGALNKTGFGWTKEGYDFAGWYTTSSDAEIATAKAVTTLDVAADATFYAGWKVKITSSEPTGEGEYTITYDINGGTGTVPSAYKADMDAVITLPTSAGFSRSGYTFIGWYTTKEDTSGTGYPAGGQYTVKGNATLYAQWAQSEAEGPTVLTPTDLPVLERYTATISAAEKETKTTVTFAIKSPDNYTVERIYVYTADEDAAVDGTKIASVSDNTITITQADPFTEDTTYWLVFKQKNRSLSERMAVYIYVEPDGGTLTVAPGTVTGEGTVVVSDDTTPFLTEGDLVKVVAKAKAGWELESICAYETDSDVEVELTKVDDTTYSFEMPAVDVQVNAKFVKSALTIAFDVTGNTGNSKVVVTRNGNFPAPGTYKASADTNVYYIGESIKIDVTVDGKQELESFEVTYTTDGDTATAYTHVIDDPQATVTHTMAMLPGLTIKAAFTDFLPRYTASVDPAVGGTVKLKGPAGTTTQYRVDDEVQVIVTPDAGYQLTKLNVYNASNSVVSLTPSVTTSAAPATYTFVMPYSNVTVEAVFEAIPYTIKVALTGQTAGDSLTIDVDGDEADYSVFKDAVSGYTVGQTVTIKLESENAFKTLDVTYGAADDAVALSPEFDDKAPLKQYAFTMPAGNVTITASLDADPTKGSAALASLKVYGIADAISGTLDGTPLEAFDTVELRDKYGVASLAEMKSVEPKTITLPNNIGKISAKQFAYTAVDDAGTVNVKAYVVSASYTFATLSDLNASSVATRITSSGATIPTSDLYKNGTKLLFVCTTAEDLMFYVFDVEFEELELEVAIDNATTWGGLSNAELGDYTQATAKRGVQTKYYYVFNDFTSYYIADLDVAAAATDKIDGTFWPETLIGEADTVNHFAIIKVCIPKGLGLTGATTYKVWADSYNVAVADYLTADDTDYDAIVPCAVKVGDSKVNIAVYDAVSDTKIVETTVYWTMGDTDSGAGTRNIVTLPQLEENDVFLKFESSTSGLGVLVSDEIATTAGAFTVYEGDGQATVRVFGTPKQVKGHAWNGSSGFGGANSDYFVLLDIAAYDVLGDTTAICLAGYNSNLNSPALNPRYGKGAAAGKENDGTTHFYFTINLVDTGDSAYNAEGRYVAVDWVASGDAGVNGTGFTADITYKIDLSGLTVPEGGFFTGTTHPTNE